MALRDHYYGFYVLGLLTFAFLLNQLDRYMLAIVTKPMAQEIHYGLKGCMLNSSFDVHLSTCELKKDAAETKCEEIQDKKGNHVCIWDYTGQGFAYQVLAGPVFIVVYTFVGVPLGFAADAYSRKNLLVTGLVIWSAMTLLMGFVKEYWHLVVLRFLQGIGQAGCTPFASSLIADYFEDKYRGTSLSVYNWGIYVGYSASFAVGNFVTKAIGWRWAFIVSGLPGFVLGAVILFTLKEPKRRLRTDTHDARDIKSLLGHTEADLSCCRKLSLVLKPFARPTLMLLVIAGSLRNAGGYVWAYNVQAYFESIHQSAEEIGRYMSWIPLVGGSVGVVVGGVISDVLLKKCGALGRVGVLVISQVAATPFVAGALYFKPPWAYISLIPGYIMGEMWIGVTLAVGLELVPTPLRASAVAVYLFIISNIGGNMTLLVPPLTRAFNRLHNYTYSQSLRAALYILYPGLYLAGALFFLFTMLVLRRDLKRYIVQQYHEQLEQDIRDQATDTQATDRQSSEDKEESD